MITESTGENPCSSVAKHVLAGELDPRQTENMFDLGRSAGPAPLIIGVAAIIVLLAAAAYTSYTLVLAIIAAAVAAVIILHFLHKRPVKMPGDDVRLNLDRDDDTRK
ncbi:MAG: hypothetical protein ACE14M_06220 [Terriglobales bacterium]